MRVDGFGWIVVLFLLSHHAAVSAMPSSQAPSASVSPPGAPGALPQERRASTPARTSFRSGADLVALDVCVKDRDGRFISGLTRDDFVILDEGRPQAPSVFVADGRVPLAVAVLVDRSGSMAGEKLERAKAAAAAFIRMLGQEDLVEVLAFDARVERVVPFGADRPAANAGIAGLTAGGQTGLFEAIKVALWDLGRVNSRPRGEPRKGILVLSDGEDTSSRLTFEDVLEEVRQSGVLVYAVSLRTDDRNRPLAAPYQLAQFAFDTGGRAIAVTDLSSLTPIYEAIAAELSHLYRLGYAPAPAVRDGRWHALSVRVRYPDARVRTRTGYYAPGPPSKFGKEGTR